MTGKFIKPSSLAALTVLIAYPSQGASINGCPSRQTPRAALDDGTSLLQLVSSHGHIEVKPGTNSKKLSARNAANPKNSSLLHELGTSSHTDKISHEYMKRSSRTVTGESDKLVTSSNDVSAATGVAYFFLACYISYSLLTIWFEFRSRREDSSNQVKSPNAEEYVSAHRSPGWDILKLVCTLFVIAHHYGVASLQQYSGKMMEDEVHKFEAYLQTTVTVGSALTMCMFSFISGVFGTRLSWSSFANMCCYTVVANILYTLLYWSVSAIVQGKFESPTLKTSPGTTWYLVALFVWRIGITPVFMAANSFGIHRIFVAAVLLISFFFLFCWYPVRHPSLPFGLYTHPSVYFAQYYTVGCILSVKQWTELLKHQYSLAVAAFCFVTWFICLAAFEPFRLWADSMCIHASQCAFDTHFWYPDSLTTISLSQGLSLATAGVWFRSSLQKIFVVLVFSCLTLNVVNRIHQIVPRLVNFLAECGSRSLYGWLVTFFIQWQIASNPQYGIYNLMVVTLSTFPQALITTFLYLLSLHNLFVFTSRLTSLIWAPILQPFWVLDLIDKFRRSDVGGKEGKESQS